MITTMIAMPMRLTASVIARDVVRAMGSNPERANVSKMNELDGEAWFSESRSPFGVGDRNRVEVLSFSQPYQWHTPMDQRGLEARADAIQQRYTNELGSKHTMDWDDALAEAAEEDLDLASYYADYPEKVYTTVRIMTDAKAGSGSDDILWEHLVYARRLRHHARLGTFGDWRYPDNNTWNMLAGSGNDALIAKLRGRNESETDVVEKMVAAERRINAAGGSV